MLSFFSFGSHIERAVRGRLYPWVSYQESEVVALWPALPFPLSKDVVTSSISKKQTFTFLPLVEQPVSARRVSTISNFFIFAPELVSFKYSYHEGDN